MISIIDYGMGNLRSVRNAFAYLGVPSRLIQTPEEVLASDRLLVPGVGSFREAMQNLASLRLVEPVREMARRGAPVLGICLGMQLLAEEGQEGGACEGIGLLPGMARRLEPADPRVKIPHMGFNEVRFTREIPLFAGVPDGSHFYFAHSYQFLGNEANVAGVTVHGAPFASVVARANVIGAQFHPEKSQSHGLAVLRNFSETLPC